MQLYGHNLSGVRSQELGDIQIEKKATPGITKHVDTR